MLKQRMIMGTKHSIEFKQEAVRIALTSGLTRKQVASDLAIGFSTLSRWVQQDQKSIREPNVQPNLKNDALKENGSDAGQIKAENEFLLLQLHNIREDLETLSAEAKAQNDVQQQALIEASEREVALYRLVAERDSEIYRFYNSVSWRITAPLRNIKARLHRERSGDT